MAAMVATSVPTPMAAMVATGPWTQRVALAVEEETEATLELPFSKKTREGSGAKAVLAATFLCECHRHLPTLPQWTFRVARVAEAGRASPRKQPRVGLAGPVPEALRMDKMVCPQRKFRRDRLALVPTAV